MTIVSRRSGNILRSVPILRPRTPGDELFDKPAPEGMVWRVISQEEVEAEKAAERRLIAEAEQRRNVWWRVVLRKFRIWKP